MSALRGFERVWAEALFEAILGPVEEHGLPAFREIDRDGFYQAIDTAPGPAFAPGLRGMVYALNFAPVVDRRFGRPFHTLDVEARLRCVDALAKDERYVVRQLLSTMKILACFAYYEDPRVRARAKPRLDHDAVGVR